MGIELIDVDFDNIVGKECLSHILSGDFPKALAVFEIIKKDPNSLKDFNTEIEESIKTQLQAPVENLAKLSNIKRFSKKCNSSIEITKSTPKKENKITAKLTPINLDIYQTKEEQIDLLEKDLEKVKGTFTAKGKPVESIKDRMIKSLKQDENLHKVFNTYLKNTDQTFSDIILHRNTEKAKDRQFKTLGGRTFLRCLNIIHKLSYSNPKKLIDRDDILREFINVYGDKNGQPSTLKDLLKAIAKSKIIEYLKEEGHRGKSKIRLIKSDYISYPREHIKTVAKLKIPSVAKAAPKIPEVSSDFLRNCKNLSNEQLSLRDKILANEEAYPTLITLLQKQNLNGFFKECLATKKNITMVNSTLEKILSIIYIKNKGFTRYKTSDLAKHLKKLAKLSKKPSNTTVTPYLSLLFRAGLIINYNKHNVIVVPHSEKSKAKSSHWNVSRVDGLHKAYFQKI